MEARFSISERKLFFLLIGIAMVSAVGITMAAIPDPGHEWGEVDCVGCIDTAHLADSSVTDGKLAGGIAWSKINAPADIKDGDQVGITSENDPKVQPWAKTGGTCPCGACWATRTTACNPFCGAICYDKVELCTPAGWRTMTGTKRTGQDCCSCFVAGTKISMADGSLKSIEDVEVGDKVLGADSEVNTVKSLEGPIIGSRGTFIINDRVEVTGEHPFLSAHGWRVPDLELFHAQREAHQRYLDIEPSELNIGDILITGEGFETVESIEKSMERPQQEVVYDFIVDGSHTYLADGYVVWDAK